MVAPGREKGDKKGDILIFAPPTARHVAALCIGENQNVPSSSLDAVWLDEFWPGPVALCILGKLRFDQMPTYVARELEPAIDAHAANMTKRRTRCHILFYQAAQKRVAGDEKACLRVMRECYAVENPIDEQEWYLARFETERSAGNEL